MSKFKLGDKVKIVECLSENIRFRYINKIATITKVTVDNEYKIDLDNGKYFWYPFEFELYEKQTKEYNIHNLLNDFDEGIVFQDIDLRYKIYCGSLYYWDSEEQTPIWRKSINSLKQILDMKFTKVEEPKLKPMTFEEAVRTGNKVKYEFFNDKQDNFYMPNKTIQSIVDLYPIKTTAIILEGTWFAEGVYEE